MTIESLSIAEEVVTRLRARPHWRVLIEPQVFAPRFSSARAALDAVLECRVHLRGWDFPHLGEIPYGGNIERGDGWESWSEWKDTEAWLVTTSGQFIHYLTLREDRPGLENSCGRVLALEATVYQLTEIFQFASRLTSKADYFPAVRISVGISGTTDRALGRQLPDGKLEPLGAIPFASYVCAEPAISTEAIVGPGELRYRSCELARGALAELLAHFGFTPPLVLVEDLQQALLTRRLSA